MKNSKDKNIISFCSNKARLVTVSCCVVFMSLISCDSNDDDSIIADCGNGTWIQSVQTELNTWIAAGQAYGENPSLSNCNSYKSAGLAYIDALDEIRNCVSNISLEDFNNALDEANAEIDAISCE